MMGTHHKIVNVCSPSWLLASLTQKDNGTWEPPRCPPVGDWIHKLWSIQTLGYHKALKKNELSNHEKTWKNLTCLLVSEGG